ncbi:MAG: DUF721 domain-containing protein [Acidimicrobiales bacterium]
MTDQPKPFGPGLERLLAHLGAPKASTVTDVFDRWPELVGAEIAEHSRPVSFSNRTLVIAVEDPAWASQLQWAENQLVDRLAQQLGNNEIKALDIRVR